MKKRIFFIIFLIFAVCFPAGTFFDDIKVELAENGKILYTLEAGTVKTSLLNAGNYDGGLFITALYDGNGLLTSAAEGIREDGMICTSMYVPDSSYSLKAFLWDGSVLRPLEMPYVLPDKERVLEEFRDLFSDYFVYAANQYDPLTGGIYATKSYAQNPSKKPDLQSTAQFIGALKFGGILPDMPEVIKNKMVSYIQGCQDPDTGYFIDNEKTAASDREKGRALSFATSSLLLLGAEPLYLLPAQRTTAVYSSYSVSLLSLPDYLASPASFRSWIESLEWSSNAWGAADKLAAAEMLLNGMAESEKNEYLNEIWDFAEKNQNPETGFWGGGGWFRELSGAYKLSSVYDKYRKNMPNPEKILDSVLYTMRNDTYSNMCFIRNPVELLCVLRKEAPIKELINEKIPDIIGLTRDNMKLFKHSDGGFSYSIGAADFSGLDESDMNACANARLACQYAYTICGRGVPDFSEYTRSVYAIMEKKERADDYYDIDLNKIQ